MSIKLGKYSFEGPLASIDKLKDKQGVYAIVCEIERELFLLDVGESSKIRIRIENHDKKECWKKSCNGQLKIFVHYTLFLEQQDRMLIEQELRELYHPACEADKKALFK